MKGSRVQISVSAQSKKDEKYFRPFCFFALRISTFPLNPPLKRGTCRRITLLQNTLSKKDEKYFRPFSFLLFAYRHSPKPRIAPNRLIDRAVEQICNSFIIGRSPRIFMQHHQAMLRLKMKILGMTRCVFPTKFFLPPRNRFTRSIFPLAHRHASKYSENLGRNPIIFTTFVW